jgi:hypothetical protein
MEETRRNNEIKMATAVYGQCHAVRKKGGEETEEEVLRKDRQTDRQTALVA